MKYNLIDKYFSLSVLLPAQYMKEDSFIRSLMNRIESILWLRYGYDIGLKHTFKL